MILTEVLKKNQIKFASWIKIITQEEGCTYYFGPFSSFDEAELYSGSYIEGLEAQGNQIIEVKIMDDKPTKLTTAFAV